MKIAHIALWTQSLELQAEFWTVFFKAKINKKYSSKSNPGFESYFVTISNNISIELMTKPGLKASSQDNNTTGWVHLAISVGSEDSVNLLAKNAEFEGILVSAPRLTGDGYYEAVIKDPDGNLIEIVA